MRKESAWRKGASRLLVLVLTLAVIFTFSFTNVSFATESESSGTSGGEVTAKKEIVNTEVDQNTGKPTYTVKLSLSGNSFTTVTEDAGEANVVLVLDKSGSMAICGSTNFTWENHKGWVCDTCGTGYWQHDKPEVCTQPDTSGNTRMETAKSAANSFIDQILSNGSKSHLAIVAFDGDKGGTTEKNTETQSTELVSKSGKDYLHNFVNALSAEGGTNYTAALSRTQDILDGSDLPSYVVFISDGEPGRSGGAYSKYNWNGLYQATALKQGGTKIFSIGIGDQISNNAATALRNLASNGNYTQISDSNLATDLPDVLSGLAQTITSSYPAAKSLKMTDIVNTEKFNLVSGSLSSGLSNDNGTLTWDLGDFPAAGTASDSRSVTFQVTPNNDVYGKLNTNSDVSVSYKDGLSGETKTISKDKIGDPTVHLYKAVYLDDKGKEITYFGGLASLENAPTPSSDPTKKGYTFAGWDEGTVSEDGYVKTFKPTWTKNQVTIHYDLAGGNGNIEDSKADIDSIATVSDAKVTRENYTFTRWKSSTDGKTYKGGESIKVGEENITLTAQWKENSKVKVHYDLNKGKADKDGNPKDAEVYENKDYTISSAAVTRENYVFAGWKSSIDGKTYKGGVSINVGKKGVTLTAQWKEDKNNNGIADEDEDKYTVTYTDGAGHKAFEDKVFPDLLSGTATPKFEAPKWKGHVFAGWDKEIAKTVTEDATYTAQWKDDKNNNGKADDEEQKYTVKYIDGVNGTVFTDQITEGLLEGAATPAFQGIVPNRKDYVFANWKPVVSPTVTGDVTYVAQWKDDKNNNGKADDTEEKYTVTYKDGADQKVFKDQTYKDLLSGTATPAFKGTTTRSGYKFSGWTPKLDEKVTKNVTYTAVWTKEETPVKPSEPVTPVTPVKPAEEHTVTITPNNGQPDIIQTVPDGGNAVEPDDLKKDGYTIDGYYTDPEMTKAFDFSQPIKSSTHVYVKWTKTNKPVKPGTSSSKKVSGILLPKVVANGKHTQTLTWTALKNVDGYFIYTNHCDKADKEYPFKKAATYKASKARVYKVKNLKTGHNYKYYVAAYKIKNGKKVVVRNSVTVHSVAGNTSARSTNVKSVKAKKHSITLKKGKSCTLKASISKMNKKRAFLDSTHCGLLRYLSADSRIATVDYNTGKITAKKAGKTTVYVLGVNGIRDKCTVTVK